jgi:hypothetical protein
MNNLYFIINVPNKKPIAIAIADSKLHGDASVMYEAEQQGLLTYEETNTNTWYVSRISEAQYNDIKAM